MTILIPNTTLQNRYRVVQRIGEGGQGAVYEAIDLRLNNTVALKQNSHSRNEDRESFEREARLLASLFHSALPRVTDYFIDDNGQFLVMEYMPGESFAEMLRRNKAGFAVHEVQRWADQLLDALDYLHSQEPPVIHRDITPRNIKLTSRGQIILLDFGLAKDALGTIVRGFSRHYAPPEQVNGMTTDQRSDIYSFAATLYHMLTGVVPPDAINRLEAVQTNKTDPLRMANEIKSEVSHNVASVLMQAMDLDRKKRPSSADEVRTSLLGLPGRDDQGISTVIINRGNAAPSTNLHLPERDNELGEATSDILEASSSPFGTKGLVRRYLRGSIYYISSRGTPTVSWPSIENDTSFRVSDSLIGKRYEAMGGTGSQLGFPLWNVDRAWDNSLRKDCTFWGHVQWFEGGNIYQLERFGAHAILKGRILSKFREFEVWMEEKCKQMTGGVLGFPISDQLEITSSSGTKGMLQRFIYGCVIGWDKGAFAVCQGIYDLYQSIGEWNTGLGFPLNDEIEFTSNVSGQKGAIQWFEDACIQWNNYAYYISAPIYETWRDNYKKLGFALNSISVVNDSRQQDFEGGRVVVRNSGAISIMPKVG